MANKLYRVPITIHATAYIKAKSVHEADTLAKVLKGTEFSLAIGDDAGVAVSGRAFDHPDLPTVSLSPVTTIGDNENPELVE
jgi:hypothetical protein